VVESSNDNQNFATIAKVKFTGYALNGKAYKLERLNQSLYTG
jgi:hypothetical protein